MSFNLPELPYAHDSLSSLGMSKETLEFHHDIHHKAYVDNGNKLLSESEHQGKSIEEIIISTFEYIETFFKGIFNVKQNSNNKYEDNV